MNIFHRSVSAIALSLSVCFSANASESDYTSFVETQIGTQGSGLGCGFTFVGATYPFGMMQFTPAFFSPHKGIVVNQISGAGCPNLGNFPALPIVGKLKKSPKDMSDFPSYKEINASKAGYFEATMPDGVNYKTTVSKRSGIAQFSFPRSSELNTIIIGSGVSSSFVNNAIIKITSPKSCEGFAEGGEMCGYATRYKVYFVAEFSKDAQEHGTWREGDLRKDRLIAGGTNSGAYFTFNTSDSCPVEYKVAISYVSIENARENLAKDNAGRNFEQVKSDTEKEWNKYLGTIAVETVDADRKKQFYTGLYHSLIHPNVFSDVNGEYIGSDFSVHKVAPGREYYTTFSGWDTYRTQCHLVAMLFPDKASDMMQSAVDFAEQCGGYGRWITANIETGIMHGDPMPLIIANTYAFGGRNFDLNTAYKHMKRGAMVAGTLSQDVVVRPELENYIEKGVANASLCLEYTSADYAIGQFALQALGNKSDAEFFMKRSGNWVNLYDPSTNWLRSRHAHDMSWKDPDHDWREATKENYFWMVPYDIDGLIAKMGGKKVAEQRLDTLFVRLDASYDEHHFAAGNEPDFQVPWIYNWTDKPYKTSEIIHRIFNEVYSSKPTGLPGNDDCGAMGAWYVFASLGIYPMVPGVATLSVNAPQFEYIAIKLPSGKTLEIEGGRSSMSYIKSVKLNDKTIDKPILNWSQLENGGNIKFVVSPTPNTKWGK